MKYYFAPLEGITRYVYRNAFEKTFGGIDKYFAPFISPTKDSPLTPRNRMELESENNSSLNLVPQILCNNPEVFIDAASRLIDMGYKEINLNAGCPSATVTSKKKGAGLLEDLYNLERLLDSIVNFGLASGLKISVKTRLGRFDQDEFFKVLEIYNEFPLSELIIHPRIEKDFYKGDVRIDFFKYALEESKNPIVYNGDLFKKDDIRKISQLAENSPAFNDALMLGRGLLINPYLLFRQDGDGKIDQLFFKFHKEIYEGYKEIMSPDKNVLYHMKELWTYWARNIEGCDKEIKSIMKSKRYEEYDIGLNKIKAKLMA